MHYRIPGLYPLGTSGTPPVVTIKNISGHCQMSHPEVTITSSCEPLLYTDRQKYFWENKYHQITPLLRKLQCSLKKKLTPRGLAGHFTAWPPCTVSSPILPSHTLKQVSLSHSVHVTSAWYLPLSCPFINSCLPFKSELKDPHLWEDIYIAFLYLTCIPIMDVLLLQ